VPGSFLTFGDDAGTLWIYDIGGTLRFQVALNGEINNAPAVIATTTGPMIYFGTLTGHFYGINANTGAIVVDLVPTLGGAQSFDTSSVALTMAGIAYIGGENGYLYIFS
jgi:outer membrane protein assembly factor BamB